MKAEWTNMVNRIRQTVENIEDGGFICPYVFCFDSSARTTFEKTIKEFEKYGFKTLDINQYSTINPEDYSIPVTECDFRDETGKVTINDALVDDLKKIRLILQAKLNRLENIVDNKTVLIITYNDLFLQNSPFYDEIHNENALYERIRTWLKKGYKNSETPLTALVLFEKKEKMEDFSPYGHNVLSIIEE